MFKYATGSNGMTGSDAELRDRIYELSETTHRPGSLARVHRVHEWNKDADDDLVDKISKIVVNGASPGGGANVAGENDLPTYVAAAHAASDSAGMSSEIPESLREILRNRVEDLRRNRKLLGTPRPWRTVVRVWNRSI